MDELIEYLRGVAENANLPQHMRDRLTEAAAALEAAREDAAEAKQNGYELGLLAAAREDAWQPIETAPKDGTRVLLRIEWSDEPVVGEFTHDRWWACTEHHEVWCGTYCHGGKVGSYKDMKPIAWAPIPPIDAAIDQARGKGVE